MKNNFNKAFTLVELIVVITILAVLATVAFISFQWYTSSSRDSVRLADLKNISKSFEITRTKNVDFPLPDKKIDISSSGTIFQYQWELSQNILEKNLNIFDWGLDPVTKKPYGYAVNTARNKFQIIWFLENSENIGNISANKSFAENTDKYVKSSGDSLGILLDENTNDIIVQSGSLTQIDIENNTENYSIIIDKKINTWDSDEIKSLLWYRMNQQWSCYSILLNGNSNWDWVYTINPTWIDWEEFEVYCDMKTHWGGWTLAARWIAGQVNLLSESDGTLSSPNQNTKARLSTQDIIQIWKITWNTYETRFLFDSFNENYFHQWNNGFSWEYENRVITNGNPTQESMKNSYTENYINRTISYTTWCTVWVSPFSGWSPCYTLWKYEWLCQTWFWRVASCANRWWTNTTSEWKHHRNGTFWVK